MVEDSPVYYTPSRCFRITFVAVYLYEAMTHIFDTTINTYIILQNIVLQYVFKRSIIRRYDVVVLRYLNWKFYICK